MTDEQQYERKLRELHDYVRHVFQLTVVWFTFFATVNYATMGWLAKSDATPGNRGLLWLVSLLFITQNLLGMAACLVVRRYVLDRDAEVMELERKVGASARTERAPPLSSSVPAALYSKTIGLMGFALGLILITWCAIPFIGRCWFR